MIAGRQQSTLAGIDSRWKLAQDRYAQEYRKLFNADGSKIFSYKEHATRLDAIGAGLQKAADQARAGCQAVIDACDSTLAAINLDPLLQVHNPAQRDEATYKAPFIAENCKTMALPALTTQLEAITQHGSTIERLLYVRYAGERLRGPTAGDVRSSGWLEANAALVALEGGEKGEDRKAAETVKQQAYRQLMRVNLDLSGLIGDTQAVAGERSLAASKF